jgi:soluble lytic murein transglycosylase
MTKSHWARWACAALIAFHPLLQASSGVTTVNVSADQISAAPRWMFDSKVKIKGGKLIELLVAAKKALQGKERGKCLSSLQQAYALGKSLGPWLVWNQLQCAQLADNHGNVSSEALNAAINRLEAQPRWLVFGPAVSSLRTAYVSALLILAESQLKSERRSAWKTLDKLQAVHPWLNVNERADVYRWGGDLAFIEQDLVVAQDFLLRSLSEKENADVRTRVASIRNSLQNEKRSAGEKEDARPLEKAAPPNNPELGVSDPERELAARMNSAFTAQDYIPAIEDGVQLLLRFPSSRHAVDAADRIAEVYNTIASRSEDKYKHVRETVMHEMEKADATHLARWATSAYVRGYYPDALELAEKSYSKYEHQPEGGKMLLLAGKAGIASGEYKQARKNFEQLLIEASGTNEALEGNFRLGLLHFREHRYPEAAAFFERLLALSGSKDYEYRSLYWQWRAQQKMSGGRADSFAETLINKFPLSYYGLRAKAELNGGELHLDDKPLAIKTELHLLDTDRLAWERLNIFLKAGWLKEAEKELDVLPAPQTPMDRLVRARVLGAILRYDLAVQMVNKALDESPEFQQIAVLKLVFPTEYEKSIARESTGLGISPHWIRSVIRQESTFRPDAKSTSNALGVMQLLPATGSDLAREFKLKDFQVPESLLNPDINIKLGSAYLARMVHGFSGNVPLGLAAYNAGPARLKRWLSSRADLAGLDKQASSSPEVEVWMDELPWDETSFYVKAILRNWLLYRLMDGSKLSLSDPIWLDGKADTR